MEIEQFDSEKLIAFIKRNIIPICLGSLGLLLLIAGLFQAVTAKSSEPELVFEENKADTTEIELIIDVSGAVINPGVYKLKPNSRMVDALAAAGGLSSDADRKFVEKNINLAAKVNDGLKIYIPRIGEEILSQTDSKVVDSGGQVININLASNSDLESLPGIGQVTAQKIIDGRPYTSIEELQTKDIVGNATYEKIKDKIAAN